MHLKLFLWERNIATMTDYLPVEIVDIIIEYGRSNENARECARLYALRFPNRRHPSRQTISNLIARARDGRLRRQRKKKDRTKETMLNIAILGMVTFNPHVSQRRISLKLHASLSHGKPSFKGESLPPVPHWKTSGFDWWSERDTRSNFDGLCKDWKKITCFPTRCFLAKRPHSTITEISIAITVITIQILIRFSYVA